MGSYSKAIKTTPCFGHVWRSTSITRYPNTTRIFTTQGIISPAIKAKGMLDFLYQKFSIRNHFKATAHFIAVSKRLCLELVTLPSIFVLAHQVTHTGKSIKLRKT
jgi:hypothetical protein